MANGSSYSWMVPWKAGGGQKNRCRGILLGNSVMGYFFWGGRGIFGGPKAPLLGFIFFFLIGAKLKKKKNCFEEILGVGAHSFFYFLVGYSPSNKRGKMPFFFSHKISFFHELG